MRKFDTCVRNLVAAAAVALTVSACVVVPARGYYGGGYYTGAVTIAPPAPQVEVYGPAPAGIPLDRRLLELGQQPPRVGSVDTGRLRVPGSAGYRITGSGAAMAGT